MASGVAKRLADPLRAADFLPEVWLPDSDTERLRRLVARRNQVVRHRTRIRNEVHAILHTHLIPPCPHADLFGPTGPDLAVAPGRAGRRVCRNRTAPAGARSAKR